ncbi:MAG: hypothetical protein IJJ59_10095 [Pseudobutyrivibrio sp.]|uniref:hypothetical protein n=1 Tax=Pseudobutyrivibrio sp. TaxID=2014367 RepID=UPI0025D2F961|nr:hypothetical protein [Pseudobutyrivibrio sp.]MBQ6463661.1 hypothetical protein [Pseudobutyrivibrio sp.]
MSKLTDFQNWLSEKADNMGKAHIKKQQGMDNGEDEAVKYLDIPIIGGLIYLVASYSRALRVVQLNKEEQFQRQNVRTVTKTRNKVKRNIERQITDLFLDKSVAIIDVPSDNMAEFLEVVKEMDVGVQQLEANKFMIAAKEGAVI